MRREMRTQPRAYRQHFLPDEPSIDGRAMEGREPHSALQRGRSETVRLSYAGGNAGDRTAARKRGSGAVPDRLLRQAPGRACLAGGLRTSPAGEKDRLYWFGDQALLCDLKSAEVLACHVAAES